MAQIEKAPIESVRATCPGSYMFKIQSFSLLSEFVQKSDDVECFKSPEFESGGHKWKLAIYPDGNKKLEVEDHISYLVAEDADIDSVESGIQVIFKMAVYDHYRDKFLTIQESVRATCPGSYMFKIQSFSLLSEFVQEAPDFECFESPEFEYSGHKWKLSVYPNGNKKLGVEDHISLYLVAEDADIDSVESGISISVIFKMSVYDNFHDNFLIIQDNEERRFHGLKKKWGFARLISIERFKDANNGYLVNDCCVFGVQIFVLTSGIRSGNLVTIKPPNNGIFTWKLDSISSLSGNVTKEFEVQGHKWKLSIYPKGSSSGKGTHLSMFLSPSGGSHKLYVRYVLRVRDLVNGKHCEKTISHCFAEPYLGCGVPKFISLSDLEEKTRGFILNDSLIAEVEVNFVSKTTMTSC